jgi:hydroxymethylglutaryl-CoA reductase (NADPH)
LVRFRFHTGDAMGMNMVTIACDRIVRELIEPGTGVRCVALSSNYCTDKKSSAVNFQLGRGKRVIAECVLDAATLERTLKTRAELLVEVQLRKNLHGSIAAGSMGYNAQFANVLAALFVATGQDLAHVVEGAMGLTHFEPRADGGVYSSVTLPDLPVAAIGGGTGLATQREALAILGIVPDPQRPGLAARRLAAIAGAVVLAGELSLMAAFTSNDLARAHERLGRGAGDVS